MYLPQAKQGDCKCPKYLNWPPFNTCSSFCAPSSFRISYPSTRGRSPDILWSSDNSSIVSHSTLRYSSLKVPLALCVFLTCPQVSLSECPPPFRSPAKQHSQFISSAACSSFCLRPYFLSYVFVFVSTQYWKKKDCSIFSLLRDVLHRTFWNRNKKSTLKPHKTVKLIAIRNLINISKNQHWNGKYTTTKFNIGVGVIVWRSHPTGQSTWSVVCFVFPTKRLFMFHSHMKIDVSVSNDITVSAHFHEFFTLARMLSNTTTRGHCSESNWSCTNLRLSFATVQSPSSCSSVNVSVPEQSTFIQMFKSSHQLAKPFLKKSAIFSTSSSFGHMLHCSPQLPELCISSTSRTQKERTLNSTPSSSWRSSDTQNHTSIWLFLLFTLQSLCFTTSCLQKHDFTRWSDTEGKPAVSLLHWRLWDILALHAEPCIKKLLNNILYHVSFVH